MGTCTRMDTMTVSDIPIRAVDLIGAVLMIIFSLLSLRLANRIIKSHSNNVIWIYLFWVCIALAVFAISRSAGHILKQVLVFYGHQNWWDKIRPFSGAVNTFTFLVVGAITLFFERSWHIYQQMVRDQQALKTAHEDLLYMNRNLEQLVYERTTALAETEKQVAQAEKLASVGQLSAGVAHEINNPLGVILGYTQLLLRNEDEHSERYADLKTIEKHVQNCKTIVENLLNFARSSKTCVAFAHMTEIVDEMVHFVKHHSDWRKIRFEVDHAPDIPPVLIDEKKIKQVLVNLLMNAKHAIGRKGKICISSRFDSLAKRVIIRILDDGCGIEKKVLSRIFDPFFTTKPTGEGTGLGLSVSYGIIRDHGGNISVDSEPGSGTTFMITLPVTTDKTRMEK
jgi:two-component system NtrC family sensor kinase